MKCVLHAGLHKTGSSSIQNSLSTYDDGRTFYAGLGPVNHSFAIQGVFSSDYLNFHEWVKRGLSDDQKTAKRQELREKLLAALRRTDREQVVISGEAASILSQKDTKSMATFLKDNCDEVSVVVYVRDPVGYAISSCQQHLKGGSDAALKIISPGYPGRIQRLARHFGKDSLTVRKFDPKSLVNGDVVDDFASTVGLDLALIEKKRVNESISADAMKILYNFNRRMPLLYGDRALHRSRLQFIWALDHATRDSGRPPRHLFSAIANVKAANWIGKNHGIEFDTPEASAPMADLVDWFETIGDDTVERMIAFLRHQGINQVYGRDPMKLASRMFYLAIEKGPFDRETGKFREPQGNR